MSVKKIIDCITKNNTFLITAHKNLEGDALGSEISFLNLLKKLGKKVETAEGLVFLAEDLEVSGNYDESVETFKEASEMFQDLGKLRKVKDIQKEIDRLNEFSKEMVEDEYFLNKFHVDNY